MKGNSFSVLIFEPVISGYFHRFRLALYPGRYSVLFKSHDSSVSIVLGYRLDDWGSRVQFLAGAGNFSLHHRIQNGSGVHPASYLMGYGGSFHGGKVAGA
jgi:hypothetical protein